MARSAPIATCLHSTFALWPFSAAAGRVVTALALFGGPGLVIGRLAQISVEESVQTQRKAAKKTTPAENHAQGARN